MNSGGSHHDDGDSGLDAMTAKILLVEDEAVLRHTLAFSLEQEGFTVLSTDDGVSALELAKRERPDLVVLDIMLPELDGWEVCRRLRRRSAVPVIMLSARGSEIDKVLGLEMGADDYLTKPFSTRELIARIRAALRRVALDRGAESGRGLIVVGDLRIDLDRHAVWARNERVSLSPKEFLVLRELVTHRGEVLSRDTLIDRVWGNEFMGDMKTLGVHVRWLRAKIEPDPTNPRYIVTVRGTGYMFA
jgi:two-component system, OmpR family, response regulator RegX3